METTILLIAASLVSITATARDPGASRGSLVD